jgi:hypothetical protein
MDTTPTRLVIVCWLPYAMPVYRMLKTERPNVWPHVLEALSPILIPSIVLRFVQMDGMVMLTFVVKHVKQQVLQLQILLKLAYQAVPI